MVSNKCFVRILVVALLFSMVFFSATSAYANIENDTHEEMPAMESAEHTEMEDMMAGDHMEEDEHGEEEMHMEEGEHEEEEGGHGGGGGHAHAQVPAEYANQTNPYEDNESIIAEGKVIYETACIFCHGKKGDGEGVGAKALKVPPADFTDRDMVSTMSDSFWYWKVSDGVEGAGMPAWKTVLNENQTWQIINYAMTFSEGPSTKKIEEEPFYLLTDTEAKTKGAHVVGLVANLSMLLVAGLIFIIFRR